MTAVPQLLKAGNQGLVVFFLVLLLLILAWEVLLQFPRLVVLRQSQAVLPQFPHLVVLLQLLLRLLLRLLRLFLPLAFQTCLACLLVVCPSFVIAPVV